MLHKNSLLLLVAFCFVISHGAKAEIEVNLDVLDSYHVPGDGRAMTPPPWMEPALSKQEDAPKKKAQKTKPVAELKPIPLPVKKPAAPVAPVPPEKIVTKKEPVVETPAPAVAEQAMPPVETKLEDITEPVASVESEVQPALEPVQITEPPKAEAPVDIAEDSPPSIEEVEAAEKLIEQAQQASPEEGAPVAAVEPPSADGMRVTAIGYTGEDTQLSADVQNGLRQKFIPVIQEDKAYRLGLYSFASAEVRGEKNARRLSLARALYLRTFLIEAGVDAARIDIYPLGDAADDQYKDRVDLILQQ